MRVELWQTVADALLWLQLAWIFSGFALIAYLAFKVFPAAEIMSEKDSKKTSNTREPQGIVAGNYRLESFPQHPSPSGEIAEFGSELPNRIGELS